MVDDIAISVEAVSKQFRYDSSRSGTLKSLFTGIVNSKGADARSIQHALNNVSFQIKHGEFFGIVGRNGSGKSTLLKMIAGIYQPNKGRIKINGKLVPFIELGVGFNPELTGKENVFLNGALLGFSREEIARQYTEIVKFAELEKFMDQKLKNYSSGMQVRLAFSMAVRAQADILLIDEVLAVGDADFQKKCYEYFLKLKAEKKTVVFVSHDMNAVRLYCDRAILLESSRIIDEGTAEKISDEYTRLFEESPVSKISKSAGEGVRNSGNSATITRVTVNSVVNTYSPISFTVNIKANQTTQELVLGFAIKNSAKEKLLGSNSVILRHNIKPLKQGEKTSITCTMPNVFSSGRYSIDVALQTVSYRYIDDWQDVVTFEVNNKHSSPYKLSPEFKMSEKRNEAVK